MTLSEKQDDSKTLRHSDLRIDPLKEKEKAKEETEKSNKSIEKKSFQRLLDCNIPPVTAGIDDD